MAISLVRAATGGDELGGQATIGLGGTATAGNIIIAMQAGRNITDSPVAPAGFTAHPSGAVIASTEVLGTFYKVADGTETGVAFEDLGGRWVGAVSEWSGVSHLDTSAETTGASTSMVGGTVTPSPVEALIVGAFVITTGDFATTAAPSTGWTELHDVMAPPGEFHPLLWAAYQTAGTASGSYAPAGTPTNTAGVYGAQTLVFTSGTAEPAPPGVGVEFNGDTFIDLNDDLVSWRIQRGADALVNGGGYTGSAVFVVKNTNNRYNPENTESDLFGLLRDGPRVWVAVNEDGTITPDDAKDVYGMFAGRVTEIAVILAKGQPYPPLVEFTCEDPLAWIARTPVRVAESRTRSQKALRQAILTAAGETNVDLAPEPSTMPLSGFDGLAANGLEEINKANGTRHFARPADLLADWYDYVTVRRTQRLDGTAAGTVNAGSDHVTGTSGWRVSAETVINRQTASSQPVTFSVASVPVWEAPTVPFTVAGTAVQWVEFDDFVDGPVVNANVTSGTVTSTLDSFGSTAKLTLVSAGTATVSSLRIEGSVARRALTESVVIDDTASQATPRGVRAGSDITGDFVGALASARGIAAHIVWRYADAKYRPDLTVENWMPEQFALDLYDNLAVTSSHIGVSGRIFEIIGLTHFGNRAADSGVVHHVTTYQLMESRVQEATTWFTLDQSLLDGDDHLAY